MINKINMDNLKEYLDFLELPSNTDNDTIMQRIGEKEKLFEQLLQSAPNDYLKNIHSRNIAKLSEIRAVFQKGYAYPNKEAARKQHAAEATAFLIRHTENKKSESFPLFSGKNFLGRMSNNHPHEIIIEDDIYVSRSHAVLVLEQNNCQITDLDSKNGTYVNGNEQRITTVRLNDSDTIQLGNTKFVFKSQIQKSMANLVNEVDNSEYMKTIVIDIL